MVPKCHCMETSLYHVVDSSIGKLSLSLEMIEEEKTLYPKTVSSCEDALSGLESLLTQDLSPEALHFSEVWWRRCRNGILTPFYLLLAGPLVVSPACNHQLCTYLLSRNDGQLGDKIRAEVAVWGKTIMPKESHRWEAKGVRYSCCKLRSKDCAAFPSWGFGDLSYEASLKAMSDLKGLVNYGANSEH